LYAKARVYWDFCALERRQRILDEDALAEGEELDSNLLSQDFAPVWTTMVRGSKSQRKGGEIPQKIRRSAGVAKALSGNTPGSNDPLLNEQRTQFARLEYFSS
jgi:peptidoglycan hydrolase-like protein with peptidoglycan-binding domain